MGWAMTVAVTGEIGGEDGEGWGRISERMRAVAGMFGVLARAARLGRAGRSGGEFEIGIDTITCLLKNKQ